MKIFYFLIASLLLSCTSGNRMIKVNATDSSHCRTMLVDSLVRTGDEFIAIANIKFGISKKDFKKEAKKFYRNIKQSDGVAKIGLWELGLTESEFGEIKVSDITKSDHSSLIYDTYFISDSLVSLLVDCSIFFGVGHNYTKKNYKRISNEEIFKPINSLVDILSDKYGRPDELDLGIDLVNQRKGYLRTVAYWQIRAKYIYIYAINWNDPSGNMFNTHLKLQIINYDIYNRGIERIKGKEKEILDSISLNEARQTQKSKELFKKIL